MNGFGLCRGYGRRIGRQCIIVRGNSPKGIQWRLEGIDVPNPNHFSDEGATGGPINALNSIMLANSEFYTGAFAPEFGNALSGVFDMRLRKGNNEQREYSASVGILGTEATLEGPFKRGGGSSYLLNHKFNARHNMQAGMIYTHHYFNFYNNYFDKETEEFVTDQNIKGDVGHYQGFISWKYRPLEKVSFVSGVHAHGSTLNKDLYIEPPASLRWQFHHRQALTAGFGMHGKMESLTNYFSIIPDVSGADATPNKNIGFSKATHYVAGYENQLGANLFFKVEAYYQRLYHIPVENREASSYSLINQAEWFTDRILVNKGTGQNLGLELTLERYFADSYYFLATASLYDSKYKAMDGVERNTGFNGNYVGNFLIGKEYKLKTKYEKKKVIGINSKVSLWGARRYTPINMEEFFAKDKNIWYEDRAFSDRGDDVFFINLAVTYRIDRHKTSQELKLDIQNLTNHAAKIAPYYNDTTDEVEYLNQLSLLPVLMYTVHF